MSHLPHVLLVALAVSGCDQVFDLTGYERACDLRTFAGPPTPIVNADDATRAASGRVVVVEHGLPFELGSDMTPQPIDLGVYVPFGLALAPEGDALFYSGSLEPPLLQHATRDASGAWHPGDAVPPAVFAGATTAASFGPRHVLARLVDDAPDVQELVEADAGAWVAEGATFPVDAHFAPSLVPNGLTLVFASSGATTGAPGVYAAQRDALGDAFGPPRLVLAGTYLDASLSESCDTLVAVDPATQNAEVFDR